MWSLLGSDSPPRKIVKNQSLIRLRLHLHSIVYDGAAMVKGVLLNQAVLAGENLLNNLAEVLIRFRFGKYACVADVSKYFFHSSIPEDHQDLFRIVWLKNNNLNESNLQIFLFISHVCGINSSSFAALLAFKR